MRSRRRPPPRCEDNASAGTPGRFIPSPRAIMRAPGRASQQAATLNCVRCIVRSPRTLDTAPGTSKLGVAERVGIRSRVRWNAPTEGASPLVGSPRRGHIPFGTPVRIPHTRGTYPVCQDATHVMGSGVERARFGGEGGIRTHGRVTPTAVFETARFGRSRTSPFVGCAEAPVGCVEMASASRLGRAYRGAE